MYKIIQDDFPMDPRHDYDGQVTTIIVGNRSYGGGDFNASTGERYSELLQENAAAIRWSEQHNLIHSIMAYIHSGISVRLDDYGNWPDQRWDCMPFGGIFVDPVKVRKVLGIKRISKKLLSKLDGYLQSEFTEWKNWIEDNCWIVTNEDPEDEFGFKFSGTYEECTEWIAEQTKGGSK